MNLNQLKNLDAGSWFDERFKNEKIPTLKEVLNLDYKNSKLIIEVKKSGKIYPNIEEKIVNLVNASNLSKKVIYKSFSSDILKKFHKLSPTNEILYVTIGPLIHNFMFIDDWVRFGSIFDLGFANFYQVHRILITKKLVSEVHKNKKKIIVWDVHSKEDILKMIKLNVDMIETDYTERVQQLNKAGNI